MKLGKNSPCWCGSGKKYKHCHEKFDDTMAVLKLQGQQVPGRELIKSEEDIRYIKKAAKINDAKYKHCHEKFDDTMAVLKLQGQQVPGRELIKSEEDIRYIKKAAKINDAVLDLVGEKIHAGMSTEEIDKLVYDYTTSHGGIPACLGYEGFPKSCCTSINEEVCHGIPDEKVILKEGDIVNVDCTTIVHGACLGYEGFPKSCCTSINEEVCHGIPDEKVILKEGDIVNVDCTTIVHGHYADASRMFCIGEVSPEAKRLVDVTKECLEAGIAAVRPWGHFGDIGAAIQEVAHKNGYSVVTDFCGHGVGNDFHEEPYVHHVGIRGRGMVIAPGMVFTIEPMINQGTSRLYIDEDNDWTAITEDGKLSAGIRGRGMVIAPGMVFTIEPMINQGTSRLYIDEDNDWTAITEDGKLSAQWEHTLLVTDKGVEILAK